MEMKQSNGVLKIKNGDPRWTIPVVFGDYVYPSASDLAHDKGFRKPDISAALRHNKGVLMGRVRAATVDEVKETWPESDMLFDDDRVALFMREDGRTTYGDSRTQIYSMNDIVYAGRKSVAAAAGVSLRQIAKLIEDGDVTYATRSQIKEAYPGHRWVKSRHRIRDKPVKKSGGGVRVAEKDDRIYVTKHGRRQLAIHDDDGIYFGSEELSKKLGFSHPSSVFKAVDKGRHGLRPATRVEVDAALGVKSAVVEKPPVVEPAAKFLAHAWPDRVVTIISPDGEFSMTRRNLVDFPPEMANCCEWV